MKEKFVIETEEESIGVWVAEIERVPDCIFRGETREAAAKLCMAQTFQWLSECVSTEDDYQVIRTIEFSYCDHTEITDPLGWVHCHVCGESIPHGET